MSFTYSGDPSSSAADAVRFEIPDTDANNPLLQDAEITYAITQEGGVLAAAAHCCETLARAMAAKADTVIGSLRFTYSASAENYAERAKDLRARAGTGAPYAGGISQADKDTHAGDPDRVQPRTTRGQFDNLRT